MPEDFKIVVSSRRKHPALRINRNGELEFLAPVGFPLSMVERLISNNSKLISGLRLKHELANRKRIVFCDGMQVYWYGELKCVHFTERAHASTAEGLFVPGGTENVIRNGLAELYKTEAQKYLHQRVKYLADKFGITYKSVTIGSASGRWGSCSRDGRIRFSWRLLQCDPELIDCIIIHELAHRKVFDHSFAFWQVVAQMLPEIDVLKARMREFTRKSGLL